MAKRIKNPIEVRAIILFDDVVGVGEPYQIDVVSVHYGMACEHGDIGRKGLPLEQNQEVQNIVKDFLEEGLRQAEENESIT